MIETSTSLRVESVAQENGRTLMTFTLLDGPNAGEHFYKIVPATHAARRPRTLRQRFKAFRRSVRVWVALHLLRDW